MNYLLGNDTAYLEYFDWRTNQVQMNSVRFSDLDSYSQQGYCKLCEVAKNKKHSVIDHLHYWWYGEKDVNGPSCDRGIKINI